MVTVYIKVLPEHTLSSVDLFLLECTLNCKLFFFNILVYIPKIEENKLL